MNGFLAPLEIVPRASRWLPRLRIAAHGVAAAAILVAHVPSPARSVLLLVVAVHCAISWRVRERIPCGMLRALCWDARAGWTVVTADRGAVSARLHTVTCAEPWGLAFSLEDATAQRHDVVWLSDQLDADDARRLRVHLRAKRDSSRS
jgi:hypothetical protein